MKDRIVFLDYLRVFACFLVVMVHVCESFYGVGDVPIPSEQHRVWIAVWDGLSRISVPLFIITSAYLLVPMKETMGWGDFFKRRFVRVVPPMFFFMAVYSLYPAVVGQAGWGESLKVLCGIPLNFPEIAVHLWFMYPLLGLYLLIPVLSPWLRTATARQERMFLALWAITTCLPFVNRYYGEVLGQCWWNQYYMLYDFSGYPGYLVLGHYIRYHIDWTLAKRRAVGACCLVGGSAFTVLSFFLQAEAGAVQQIADLEMAWCFCIINCVVATFGAFLLFTTISRPFPGYRLVKDISLNSYGIYLMHLLWVFAWVPVLQPLLPVGLAIPAITVCAYFSSYACVRLISMLPYSKWIVG